MSNLMTKIHDAATGEIVEREMNAEELAIIAQDKIKRDANEAAETKKAADRQAVLNKLGLTADEVAALLS
jgi:hypothetical protein